MTRRFGVHEVKEGPFKGGLHHATKRYQNFRGELEYLRMYLSNRLLPSEPEDITMQIILIILQNLLEHESEELIRHVVQHNENLEYWKFLQRIAGGYVSFNAKCKWLRERGFVGQPEWNIMDEVRRLRNDFVHSRPSKRRRVFRYRGFPLLTQRSIRRLFVDVELTLRKMRGQTGRVIPWMTVPPGYASELGWPAEFIEALEG